MRWNTTKTLHRYFKLLLGIGAILIVVMFRLVYIKLDETFSEDRRNLQLPMQNDPFLQAETRLDNLEKQIQDLQHKVIDSSHLQREFLRSKDCKNSVSQSFDSQKIPKVDVQMLDLYRQLDFSNPDGGVWKQGWELKYESDQWDKTKKLKVFVMPHSHNDPGWLKTFEQYYIDNTRHILTNMMNKLAEDQRRKFIWAEISFFKLWWDEQSEKNKTLVKSLVESGQLEFVTGGWVMPDEAVSHWIAQLTQLSQGHQWLRANLDYVPTSGWTIDPFGLSPTMPYLLKNSQLQNLLIQRVHYAVKKRLAKEKNLEFKWRQLWDNDGSTELFTHMMPFYSYDVPHTCGPDPKVCCQFDFFRLPGAGPTCPWRISPQVITKQNVARRAELLLDQYRKKSQLFKSNVVLAPLGDDFRYTKTAEWNLQYENYQRLINYMNSNHELNVEIKFGTLTDYFKAVKDELNDEDFPTLSGDFFTYADRDDHYWSGYYTSRPFHKRLDRVLLGSIRASEIIAAIGWTKGHVNLAEGTLEKRLIEARQWHSLFQHHDGVTGTAKDHVVIDYANKMIFALNSSSHVLQQAAAHVLQSQRQRPLGLALYDETVYFTLDEVRSHHTSIGERQTVMLKEGSTPRKISIYNPLPRQRTKVQTVILSTPYVRVEDRLGGVIECQISPIWIAPGEMSKIEYELSFLVTIPGFGINTYFIHPDSKTDPSSSVHFADVTLYNSETQTKPIPAFENIRVFSSAQEFTIGYESELTAFFGKSGFLEALKVDGEKIPVRVEFVKYGTSQILRSQSGAYLFMPDKPEPDVIYEEISRTVHLVTGPILSRVYLQLSHVKHTCTIFHSSGGDGLGLFISNEVDITDTRNFELAMRLSSDIDSGDEFFTDLNGLNMIRRKRFQKLPTQANYYPLPAVGYIEDKKYRMTLVTGQPLGAASMSPGQFEVMQDRRLMQDDELGVAQGVTDNLLTNNIFMLILEKKRKLCKSPAPNQPSGMLSIGGHLASDELLYPLIAMHPHVTQIVNFDEFFSPVHNDLPVNLGVVSFRVMPIPEGHGKGIGITLHRQALDLCWGGDSVHSRFDVTESGEIDLSKFLNFDGEWIIHDVPLTFHSLEAILNSPITHLCPHQIVSFFYHKKT